MTPPKDATAGEALKPCPFCGGDAFFHTLRDSDDTRIECGGNDCPMAEIYTPLLSRAEAIAAWNRRPSADPAAVEAAGPPDSNVTYIATTLLEMHERQLVAALATDDDGTWEKNRADYRSVCIASAAILAAGFLSARAAALEEAAKVADERTALRGDGDFSQGQTDMAEEIADAIRARLRPDDGPPGSASAKPTDAWRTMEYADIDTTMWIGVDALNVPDIGTLHVDERDCQELIDNITYSPGDGPFVPRRCTLLVHKAEGQAEGPPSPKGEHQNLRA